MKIAVVIAACCAFAVPLASAESQRATLRFVQVASGFDEPVYVASTPSEPQNLYVVERAGRIRVLANGKLRAQPFLDIRSQVQSGYTEQGLLSIAFHPGYAKNHRFFVYFTARNGDIHIVEYRSDGVRAIASSARLRLVVRHRENDNHDGGQLQFGPDGLLYAGTGDGGGGGDQHNHAQNVRSLLGKLLRLNVNRSGARWQIAAYGLRNPWRFSFDRVTGDLYIGDVGQDTWEEIDFRSRAGLRKLTNYGWSVYEGRAKYKNARLTPGGKLVGPVTVYNHNRGGCSVTGGYVYRGAAVPAAKGRYFYGDYCSGKIWSLRVVGGRATTVRREPTNVSGLSSFGQDARGELYAVSLEGRIYRLAG
jgi:glucose/arabinose dehydrogenase